MRTIFLLLGLLTMLYSCGGNEELSVCRDIEYNDICGEMIDSGGLLDGDIYSYTFVYELENNTRVIFGLSIMDKGDNNGEVLDNFILNRVDNPDCAEDFILFEQLDILEFGDVISGSGKGFTVCGAGSVIVKFNAII